MNKKQMLHHMLDQMIDELDAHEENTDMLDLSLRDVVMMDEENDVVRIVTLNAEIIEASDGSAAVEEFELHTQLYEGDELKNEMRLPLDTE